MTEAFYNDCDFYVAQWLGNLITAGYLPQGTVDARSILEIDPEELRPFRQCHFFVGIGGWPYALSLAGWPADREVWTGSCPCQPLSSAGQRQGHADERHLWPAFYRLIAERRPATIFGEQVASKDGREWLAGVRADLEALGYAVGAADLCAAGVGAPHIRQRLFWVADAGYLQRPARSARRIDQSSASISEQFGSGVSDGGVADAASERADGYARENEEPGRASRVEPVNGSEVSGLGDAASARCFGPVARPEGETRHQTRLLGTSEPSPWSGAEWLPCLDGKARRIEPGTFPLAHGVPARVGRLRGYGNAIVPQVAAEFISAYKAAMMLGTKDEKDI